MHAPVPDGYTTVTPWVVSPDTARLIDFLVAVFDAQELARLPGPDGGIGHAEVRIGDAVVMAFDARPHWAPTPAFLRVYVDDAQATADRAVAAGGELLTPVTPLPWGDATGRVRDDQDDVYWLQQRVEEVPQDVLLRRMGEPEWQARMAVMQSTELVRPR